MKIVIFAGGTGRRLWPISRKQSPKQFEPIVGEKSTIQLAVERLSGTYGWENIFISSNENYLGLLQEQLPDLPESNFIGEPVRRDLAAAVGLSMIHMAQRFGPDKSVAIVWGRQLHDGDVNFPPSSGYGRRDSEAWQDPYRLYG